MQFIKHQHDDNMDWMQRQGRFERVDRATADFIQTATGTNMHFHEDGEVVNMCRAWENSINQARNDGISQGKIASVLRVAEKFGISTQNAMEAVGLSQSKWDAYAPEIRQHLHETTI